MHFLKKKYSIVALYSTKHSILIYEISTIKFSKLFLVINSRSYACIFLSTLYGINIYSVQKSRAIYL